MGTFIPERDISGRVINRTASTEKGWAFLHDPTVLTTSKLNSVIRKDYTDTDKGDYAIAFYDSGDTELTTQVDIDANCVKTVFTLRLPYDYDLIEGRFTQRTVPNTAVCFWCLGGMFDNNDAPVAGYVKTFIDGIDLEDYPALATTIFDGRSSKFMPKVTEGAPYDTNVFQFIFRHGAGVQHTIQAAMEYYRA